LPKALIVCNFPILALTAEGVVGDRYEISRRTWSEHLEAPANTVDLVIADVTNLPYNRSLAMLWSKSPGARIVVCSLDQNEVEVYRVGSEGPEMETELESLLALTA